MVVTSSQIQQRGCHIGLVFYAAVLVSFLATLLTGEAGSAQAAKIRIPGGGNMAVSAQSSERDFDHGTMDLKGSVQVVYGLQYISCDHAVINEKTQEVLAEGNLVISSPMAYVEGDRALLNYKTNTGVIYNGFVKSGQVVFEGKIIHKMGEELYDAEQASFTACTTCPTAWTFEGTRISAELGGYAHIQNSILDVGGLPVFYLPYLVVPLKSQRQTGLLIPSLVFSGTGGPGLGLSYFWALSRSQDATFTETYYTKRGPKEVLNYRYMLSPTSLGELTTGTIHDQVFATDNTVFTPINPAGSRINRWFLNYDQVFDLPYNVTQRAKLSLISDLYYSRDFPEDVSGQGDPALESRLSFWHNSEDTHSSIDVNYYINQLRASPVDSNDDAVHRWPALDFSMVDHEIGNTGVMFRLSADYVNFSREGFAWDDAYQFTDPATNQPYYVLDPNRTQNPGASVFNPDTDVIRTGQRLDFQPELSYPMQVGKVLDIMPSLQFRHTQYIFNIEPPTNTTFDNTPFREYLRAQISTRTTFSRIYGPRETSPAATTPAPSMDLATAGHRQKIPGSNWTDLESQGVVVPVHPTVYRHEIEPEIILSGLPYRNLPHSPFFKGDQQEPLFLQDQPLNDTDFISGNGVQFDYYDRLWERNAATVAVENKLIRKRWIGDTPDYKQVARVRLAQSYDLDEADIAPTRRKFPWSDISMLTDLRLDGFETYTLLQYFPYHGVTNSSSRARIFNKHGDFFEVDFNQTFAITLDPSQAYQGRTENLGFGIGLDRKYFTLLTTANFYPSQFWGNLDPRSLDNPQLKGANRFTTDIKGLDNLQLKGVKGFTTDFIIKPPGNCWGVHATIIQNIGSGPTFHLNFEYKFGGETPAPAPGSAPAPGTAPAHT